MGQGCEIPWKGVLAFAQMMKTNQTLQTVDMRSPDPLECLYNYDVISDRSQDEIDQLFADLEENYSLTEWEIEFYVFILFFFSLPSLLLCNKYYRLVLRKIILA